jgi:DNA-binding NtrC family response regulator
MKVFVVDDERIIRVTLADDLRDEGYQVIEFSNASSALAHLNEVEPDIVITDLKMPGLTGIEFLKKLKEYNPAIHVILMTAFSTVNTAVEAMKLGAYDYIRKPFENEKMIITVKRIEELIKVKTENKFLREEVQPKYDLSAFVGKTPKVQELFDLIKIVADKDTSVLITGETGTGKELLTKVVHFNSNRRKKPLVKVSCAILSREIFESELFGHEKGAFTGAEKARKGRFEHADTGTIYLDDIDDVPLDLQVKLLRVLEEREVERVGGREAIKIDIRVIASTKKDLRKLVDEGKFREDLFYRLNVFPLNIPPLRERVEDIVEMAKHFVATFSPTEKISIEKEVFDILKKYPFPGNARELRNLCERLVLLSKNNVIDSSIIPPDIKFPQQVVSSTSFDNKSLNDILMEVEQNAIQNALEKSHGNKAKAAEILGLPASTLKSKIAKF